VSFAVYAQGPSIVALDDGEIALIAPLKTWSCMRAAAPSVCSSEAYHRPARGNLFYKILHTRSDGTEKTVMFSMRRRFPEAPQWSARIFPKVFQTERAAPTTASRELPDRAAGT